MIRQPIITVLGHVDHGKTTLLDYLRGTTLAQREAGKITQHIGATEIPLEVVKRVCGDLLDMFKLEFTIPGLLFVDTPGHEAFTNLRKRGGSIADLAILIVDINQGIQPQTKEAVEILKTFKVPFIVVANKVDVLPGWKNHDPCFIKNLPKQLVPTKEAYDKKYYNLLGQISELGFSPNMYTDVKDYTKEVAIVPVSSKTGEGVAELLAIIAGLSQKFLMDRLEIHEEEPAEGTILEVKEEKGIGITADVIIYNGSLKETDTVVIGGSDEIFTTKIRSLLKPNPLCEIRDKKSCFKRIKSITAAAGLRLVGTDLDKAIAGAPFMSARNDKEIDDAKEKILKEIEEVLIETDDEGIILKADALGSLEAAVNLLKQRDIAIKRATIGNISKKDVMEAASNVESDPLSAFVLGFNVSCNETFEKEAKKQKVTIICDRVIYKLIEKYEELIKEKKKLMELEAMKGLVWPGKLRIIPQYIFRQKNPAIFGVEVIGGKIKPFVGLMNKEGVSVGVIKNIEDQGEKLEELETGHQAATSVKGAVVGRNVEGGDELYVEISENNFRRWKSDAKKFLTGAETQILKEIAIIHRKDNEMWGL